MKRPEQTSLAQIALIVASMSFLVFIVSLGAYWAYVLNMNIESLMNPAANPMFNFANKGFMVAFPLAAVAVLLTLLAFVQEKNRPEKLGAPSSNKALVNAILLSVVVLGATVSSGVTPFYSPRKIKAETPDSKVVRVLKDDVGVKFGAYDDKAGAVPVTVTNKRPGATDYIIIIDAFDTSGNRLAQDSIYTTDMEGRETQNYKVFSSRYTKATPAQLKTATFKVNDVTLIDRTRP